MPASAPVLRSLYRALLRAAAPFSPPAPLAAARAALLHRSGAAHDWEGAVRAADRRRRAAAAGGDAAARGAGRRREARLPRSWARDLSRSYSDLQEEYTSSGEYFARHDGDDKDAAGDLALASSSRVDHVGASLDAPRGVLFRQLAQEWFSAGGADADALKRFPSQLTGGPSLRAVIRREFRAPTAAERDGTGGAGASAGRRGPSSSYVDTGSRIRTAFHTLRELNRKLQWARDMGLPPPPPPSSWTAMPAAREAAQEGRRRERWAQAAPGVGLWSSRRPPTPPTDKDGAEEEREAPPHGAAADADESASPLRRGTYLVAHPLMRGYFARSVVVLLDHAEDRDGARGGTYGLIVNRPARGLGTDAGPARRRRRLDALRRAWEEGQEPPARGAGPAAAPAAARPASEAPISLAQAIDADDLPETVQAAFGDAPVREGGPVNLSLQMLHRETSKGAPTTEADGAGEGEQEEGEGPGRAAPASKIGGTPLRDAAPPLQRDGDDGRTKDDADTVYFGGGVMEASYAVVDGTRDRDEFSFVIGAACWSSGQLAAEVARGCWLPFRGPPRLALTGRAELPAALPAPGVAGAPARPGPAPGTGDALWRAVLCALGEGEAALAGARPDDGHASDALGGACDDFER